MVVGISEYEEQPNLPSAKADAIAVSGAFSKIGIEVQSVLNPTLEELTKVVKEFSAETKADDQIVYYYSGHGVNTNIVPKDALSNDIENSTLSLNSLFHDLSSQSPSQGIFIFDSMFSRHPTDSSLDFVGNTENDYAILIASGSGEAAYSSSDLGHGAFTFALLENIAKYAKQKPKQNVSIDEFFHDISQDMRLQNSNFSQNPVLISYARSPILIFSSEETRD